jgi:hypothetical protein
MAIRCAGMEKDYPKRLRLDNGAVHAAHMVHFNASSSCRVDPFTGKSISTSTPAHDEVIPACGRKYSYAEKYGRYVEVDPTTPITCKNCLKKIGGEQVPSKAGCRFVLQEIESGYFFQKKGWRGSFVEDINRATTYATETTAKTHGKKSFYEHKNSGKRIKYTEYRDLPQEEKKSYKYGTEFDSETYAIREVELRLI